MSEIGSALTVTDGFTEHFDRDINKDVPNHECALPLYEHAIFRYIHSGVFVELRRKIKKFMMVSDTDREGKALFKSTAQIRQEEEEHLRNNYIMIHPFSQARFYWEVSMILWYLLQLFFIPVEISSIRSPYWILMSNVALDAVSLTDIILFFFTGYYDRVAQKVVMAPKSVVKNYLKTYFFFDFMSSLPISCVLYYTDKIETLWPLKLIMVTRLGRIPKMINYIKKLCQRMDIWSYNLKLVNFVTVFLIFLIWAASVVNLLREASGKHKNDNSSYVYRMLESCFLVVRRFMLVGLGYPAESDAERISCATCLFIGSVINMIILAQIVQIYNRRSSAKNKYNNMMQQIFEYMKYKELPHRLREKVFRFVNFKYQKHIFKEEDILSTLSSILKDEVVLYNCKSLIEKVELFRDAPRPLILRLVSKMKSEIYLPNDVIVQAGLPGNSMYFIYMGTVAAYSPNGKEMCHLHDGSHFGEIALVVQQPRMASVIAVRDCEVFRLTRRDFQEAVSPYPEFANEIRRAAMGRSKDTARLMEQLSAIDGDPRLLKVND